MDLKSLSDAELREISNELDALMQMEVMTNASKSEKLNKLIAGKRNSRLPIRALMLRVDFT